MVSDDFFMLYAALSAGKAKGCPLGTSAQENMNPGNADFCGYFVRKAPAEQGTRSGFAKQSAEHSLTT